MIILHHVAQARSFRTLWLLQEMGLEFEVRQWNFFDKSMRGPEFKALSPAARVPALEIDGRVLFESGAITEYLVETRPECGLGRAVGHEERADWLQWLHFAETIGQHLANLTQHHIALRDPAMRSPTVMRLEAKRLEKALEVVDRAVAAQEYLLGSGFSAVDVNVGYGVMIARHFVPGDLLPALDGYYQRLVARDAFALAKARDGDTVIYRDAFYAPPEEG
ncbi:MAG TPA: glutathione S-transferase family protein [Rhodobacteraceae bacterium]|nr:glutathione S-transferase family protein [Paracoccaceae bacterium]